MAARRPAIYGPEPGTERHGQVWSHWDRWFALVAVVDHDDELDKTVLAKARRKVVTQALSGRDLTGPMRHPPRRQLRERALRGSWPAFLGDPAEPYRLLAELLEDRSDIWARQTFELVRDLEALVARAGRL